MTISNAHVRVLSAGGNREFDSDSDGELSRRLFAEERVTIPVVSSPLIVAIERQIRGCEDEVECGIRATGARVDSSNMGCKLTEGYGVQTYRPYLEAGLRYSLYS